MVKHHKMDKFDIIMVQGVPIVVVQTFGLIAQPLLVDEDNSLRYELHFSLNQMEHKDR